MKLTNFTLDDLISENDKITFLIGAGCSVDSPSCQPAGRSMTEKIIQYICSESEIERITKLEDLCFEQLIEIVRDYLDPDLKIIDYYGQCNKPNLQHFFLAEMIKKGHFVMTTNFDFLIEYALFNSKVAKEEIKIVITRRNFEKYHNPEELFDKDIKTLYKIHGSTNNIVKNKDTKDMLIATIQAFGSNKDGLNIFQVEPFKKPLFDNISNNRSLIIMGYSGSDDFDIVPTLKVLQNLQNIIWINFIKDDDGKEFIYDIKSDDIDNYDGLDKITQILIDIAIMGNTSHLYRVDTNTTRMIKELLKKQNIKIKLDSDDFSLNPMHWLDENIKTPNELEKHIITRKIYFDFDLYEDTKRIIEKIKEISDETNNFNQKAINFDFLGIINMKQGKFKEAIDLFEQAINIYEDLNILSNKANSLNNIGQVYDSQGKYDNALENYKIALDIVEQLDKLELIPTYLNNVGAIYYYQCNYPEAMDYHQKALKISDELGNLAGKAQGLNNIGLIHLAQGKHSEALEYYEQALKIDEQLANISGKGSRLSNIGSIYLDTEDFSKAMDYYEKALDIAEKLGNLEKKAGILNKIGLIYKGQGELFKALEYYESSLQISEQLESIAIKGDLFNNIAGIYFRQSKIDDAIDYYIKAIPFYEEIGDLIGKANILNNLGVIKFQNSKQREALEIFDEALQIFNELELLENTLAKNLVENIEFLKNELEN